MSPPTLSTFPPLAASGRRACLALAAVGAATLAVGMAVWPARAWETLLVAAVYVVGLALSGLVFVAFHYVTGARWSSVLRRVPEAMAGVLPWGAVLVLAVLAGARWIYPWADPATVRGDEILEGRAAWMNLPFVLGRAAVVLAVWWAFGRALVRRSRAQDLDLDPAHRARNARVSGVFLFVLAPTFSIASFDWLLSTEKHWSSTIFALHQFSGLFVSGCAAVGVLTVWLRRRGALGGAVTEDVLHDVGRLVFAFSLFWAYTWFSQYLLIWYANLPDETSWFLRRHVGAWAPLSAASVLLNWTIPFAILMPRASKRREGVLLLACALVLVGRWVELWLDVAPSEFGWNGAGLLDLGLGAGAAGLFVLAWRRAFAQAPAVPAEALPAAALGTERDAA